MSSDVEEATKQRRARAEKSRDHYTSFTPEIPVVSSTEAAVRNFRGGATHLLVDVRSRREQAVGMIRGAVTKEEFESRYLNSDVGVPESYTVAPYCTIGYRSGMYARELVKRGVPASKVVNHEGVIMYTYLRKPLVVKRPSESTNTHSDPPRVQYNDVETFEVHTHSYPWSGLSDPTFKERYDGPFGLLRGSCACM